MTYLGWVQRENIIETDNLIPPDWYDESEGGYNYKRMVYMGSEKYDEKPNKNRFSHVHDALQYAMLGGGEGRRVLQGNQVHKLPTTVERASNPFHRMKRRNRISKWIKR